MRRWRMVLAGAALVVPTFLGAAPVHADETNAACRRISNLVRQLVHESSEENLNKEINQIRNAVCKSLHT